MTEELKDLEKDFLTSCYMRDGLVPVLKKLEAEFKAFKKPFTILLIDIDHFKPMNDKYGHVYGDQILQYFSSSLRLGLGEVDTIPFRYGGDEFVIVFPGKGAGEAQVLANELLRTIRRRLFLYKGKQFKMSFSGGIASFPRDGQTIEDIIENADKAMYFSKRHGHGRSIQFSQILIKRVKTIAAIVLLIAIIASSSIFARDVIINRFSEVIARLRKVEIKVDSEKDLDRVYLRSGGVFRGTIVHEDQDSIELMLKLETGEGLLVIEKSKILRIDKAKKE